MWLLRMEQWYPCQVRKQMLVANDLVHSWSTLGALLVHFWCTPGALPVHFRCTPGALSVHFTGFPKGSCFVSERKPRSFVQKRLDRSFANLQTRKGIAPLPKGSLDPPHRNVWIAFSPTCKPERGNCTASERKLRSSAQKRLDRLFTNLQTRKGNCTASERKPRSSAQKRLDRPRHYHIHHRRRRNHDQAAAEYPSDAPNQRGR